MGLTWKINGVALPGVGVKRLKLTFANMEADTCTFDDPLAAFDADLRWAFDSDIVVTSNDGSGDVTRFRGRVAETPRFLGAKAESISYTAKGRWQDLQRRAFLQQFKIATTPANPASALSDLPLGIVVLNQADGGASCYLSAALAYVINAAITAGAAITLGTITGLDFLVPWDEVFDLDCARAIKRLLDLTPDVVVWWDYTTANPTININRRANLAAVNVPVAAAGEGGLGTAYAALETVTLTPLWHLLASGVCIIYVRTDRTDGTPWLLVATDKYPGGTNPAQADCITRTVKLTGSVTQNTYLTQAVETQALATTSLAVSTLCTPAIDTATAVTHFADIDAFWKRHCPQLKAAGVTTLSYRNTYRAPESGDGGSAGASTAPNAACVRELTYGAVTDWMIEDQDIVVEIENVHSEVTYSVVTDVNTGATEIKTEKLLQKITATNASTQVYSELEDTSYTPPETAPAGLAQNIYAGVSQLHYEGTFELRGVDPLFTVGMGEVVNLTNSRAEWATMAALVQKLTLSVDDGRTTVKVGWPTQLMPAELMQLWRANRSKQPVQDANARNTGLSGNGTGDSQQALGKHHHAPAGGSASHIPPSTFKAVVTPSGAVPSVADMQAAVNTIYPLSSALATDRYPRSGDKITFYQTGQPNCLIGEVTSQDPRSPAGNTLFDFAFEANGVSGTWFMHVVQVGAYTPP